MEFPLRCDCGKELVATDGMAGMRIACACGREVRVPSLGEMRRQGPGHRADEVSLPEAETVEPLQRTSTVLLYGLIVGWMCLAGLPLVVFASFYGGPVAGVGALFSFIGQVWLFTQVFAGNPTAALIILFIPIFGTILAIKFIIDYFAIARWPLLCQVAGTVLFVAGMYFRVRH